MATVASEAAGEDTYQTIEMARFAKWAGVVGVTAAVFFLTYPNTDLRIAHLFYVGPDHFSGQDSLLVGFVRKVFLNGYIIVCALAFAGVALSRRRPWLRLEATQWIFLSLCLVVGPGLVANVLLKDNWGRARPRQVIELGGQLPFTPPLMQVGYCDRNCSFVSGEASSMFVVFFAGAALWRRRARAMIAAGVVVGSIAGLVRMATGAHFLSDIVFAGVFMALTVSALYFLFETRAVGGHARVRVAILGPTPAT